VLEHASRSRHIDPDRPPAAAGGLRSQVPDLVHGPLELLDCRQLQQAGRRERTRSFDRRSKAGIDLAASAIILGRQSHAYDAAQLTTSVDPVGIFFRPEDLTGWYSA